MDSGVVSGGIRDLCIPSDNIERAENDASPISRVGTSVEDGWRECSRGWQSHEPAALVERAATLRARPRCVNVSSPTQYYFPLPGPVAN